MRPRLFPEEARFALRLAVLAGGCELAAWAMLAASPARRALWAFAALRLLRPLWAKLGTLLPRPAIAFALLFAALFGAGAALFAPSLTGPLALIAAALPALGDLCTTCAGDSVTVERRAAAYAWIDMGQALGGMLGLALGSWSPAVAAIAAPAALLAGSVGIPDLHDRGTPRSSWPAAAYRHTLRTDLGLQLTALAFACGLLFHRPQGPEWLFLVLPPAGMALAARLEPRMANALRLPRAAGLIAAAGLLLPPLRLLALGVMFAAIPAAVARGAGEMERPIVSSLAWSALIAGAALGSVLF
jgi:hypothetical protein